MHGFAYAPSAGLQVSVPTKGIVQALADTPMLADGWPLALLTGLDSRPTPPSSTAVRCSSAANSSAMRPGRVEALRAMALLLALWFVRHARRCAEPRAPALRDTLVQRFRALAQAHCRAPPGGLLRRGS